jgi:hypothetical protein
MDRVKTGAFVARGFMHGWARARARRGAGAARERSELLEATRLNCAECGGKALYTTTSGAAFCRTHKYLAVAEMRAVARSIDNGCSERAENRKRWGRNR